MAQAEEFSFSPTFTGSVDQSSNPLLQREGETSGSAVMILDLPLQRATEQTRIRLQPHIRLQRFTDPDLGNNDDLSLGGSLVHQFERAQLSMSAQYADTSTLTTERDETGILLGDARRRTRQASLGSNYMLSESRALFAQLSYYDVDYGGETAQRLAGYRYPTLSVGERFIASDRFSFSLSGYATHLYSDAPNGDSDEAGLQIGMTYSFTELTLLNATVGRSRRTLSGENSKGTVADVSLSHEASRARFAVSYSRNLVPYGYGVFVERQQYKASTTIRLTPYLNADIGARATRNRQSVTSFVFDRRSYDDVSLGLHWRFSETWTLNAQVAATRAETISSADQVKEWRSGLGVTWSPRPRVISR